MKQTLEGLDMVAGIIPPLKFYYLKLNHADEFLVPSELKVLNHQASHSQRVCPATTRKLLFENAERT